MTHHRAPVAVLERFPRGDQVPEVLARLRDVPGIGGVLVLSTCNRYETYLSVERPLSRSDLVGLVVGSSGVEAPVVESGADVYAGDEAVRHLFTVASGLDSRALGEGEILGQLRGAVRTATEARCLDVELGSLVQWAFRAGRRARRAEGTPRGRTSVGGQGVRILRGHLHGLEGRDVLVVGAGTVAAQVVDAVLRAGGRVVVAARDPLRAGRGLPGCEVAPLGSMAELLDRVDAVVCATSSRTTVLAGSALVAAMRRRAGRPLVVLDLAVPRNVGAVPGHVPGLTVLDLDAVPGRGLPVGLEAARESVAAEAASYLSARAARRAGDLLGTVTARAEEVRREELARVRARGSEADLALLDEVTRRLVGKLLHPALVGIRDLASEGELAAARHAATHLGVRAREAPVRSEAAG